MHKCFLSRDRTTLTRAFCMYVRPRLEYACSVWSPHHIAYKRKIESVQRRFTKTFPGLAEYNYSSRLALLFLDSLELRQLRQDLILVYKIVFRLVDVNSNDYFKMNADSVTRGHVFKLLASNCRVDARKCFLARELSMSGIVYLHRR
jgi:hypothetical protein